MITSLLTLPYKASASLHIFIFVFWALFIFFIIHIINQRGKASKKNKELLKSFDDNIKKMSDNSYKDFTEGHIYKK